MSLPLDPKLASYLDRRPQNHHVVFTNGCFDVLHIGHLRILEKARSLGDVLVVGINSDNSVARIKGPQRPIIPELERKEMLEGLRAVDFVTIFEEETPYELIKKIRPSVLVKGGDWPVDKIVGHDIVTEWGGVAQSLPYVPGHSTTGILQRICKL